MKFIFFTIFILISAPSCSTITKNVEGPRIENLESTYDHALAKASPVGKRILKKSDGIITNKEIVVVGGCWDFINAVYNRSGVGEKERDTIFKSRTNGPFFVEVDDIEPGDWLYFLNHTYNESEHSAIFVGWTDRERLEALMVNYLGENKKKPAFYKKFMLDKIFHIIRPKSL